MNGPSFSARFAFVASMALFLGACERADSRISDAHRDYQAAVSSGDLAAAQRALRILVRAPGDVSRYWLALGQTERALGANREAYQAFLRASELDAANADVLRALVDLALTGDNLDAAEAHARQLELVAPGDPRTTLTYGYVALRAGDLNAADRHADELLAMMPLEASAKLLKARIFVERHQQGRAIQLLEEHSRLRPSDKASLTALASIYERQDDWAKVASYANRLRALDPSDENSLLFIEAALRSGQFAPARVTSIEMLEPSSSPDLIRSILGLWQEIWTGPQPVEDVRRLALRSAPDRRSIYAAFLNHAGRPEGAASLVAPLAKLPVTVENAGANAALADSMALRGEVTNARRRFDLVLAAHPSHLEALRGRARLALTTGRPADGVADAQRLVWLVPGSARDRLLLVRILEAAGNKREASRALWAAFHDIPSNRPIFKALRTQVYKSDGPQALVRIESEFARQRDEKLAREFL